MKAPTAKRLHSVAQRKALADQGAQSQQPENGQQSDGQPQQEARLVDPGTPILGGLQQMGRTYQSEADQAIGLNPAHGQDWWKHALESPVESFFMGKHIYNAFYGAFLDPGAIQTSVHDIWHQDNAAGWLFRNSVENVPAMQLGQMATQQSAEDIAAGGAGLAQGALPPAG